MIKIQATCLNMKYFFSVDGWNCKKVLCPSCVKVERKWNSNSGLFKVH